MSNIDTAKQIDISQSLRKDAWHRARRYRVLYIILLAPVIQLIIFHYIPIYGVVIAFKDYKINLGFFRSPWNDFEHFRRIFASVLFGRILRNTLIISFQRILFGFPAPIILALLINEIRSTAFKRTLQSIS